MPIPEKYANTILIKQNYIKKYFYFKSYYKIRKLHD